MGGSPTQSVLCALAFYFVSLMDLVQIVRAQNGTTPPSEVSALNSVFSQWGLSPAYYQWNISREPCSGAAIDATAATALDVTFGNYNPGIKCDCNGTVCHITQLQVYALDVTGGIPEELWSLTSLTYLNLVKNYLTGPLSSSIANLTQMQRLYLAGNALSGEVPKELGKLTNLTVLSISMNNFSGSLPSELGNLIKLEELYFDSSGVSGAIPLTFTALQSLLAVWGSDNELTGSIPEFIGNWSELSSLDLFRNYLTGPLSSSIANLTQMQWLSLGFNALSGEVPKELGKLTNLRSLSISTNNFSGSLPSELGNLIKLEHLFFHSSGVSGAIPSTFAALQNLQIVLGSDNELTGSIPEFIGNWSKLSVLNLVQNYLTGPLSSSIANLTQMQSLYLGYNALSGEVPKELGKLTNLTQLSISTNNFSSSLPSELGNLIKLEQFYFDSSGVSGAIPSTFAALQNLSTVWGSDNELTGSIPEFIGNWSKLSSLRFQGNAFEGGIPSTFSKLTSLTDLRISDLSYRSSSLEFLKDMTSLSTLILRNNNISGTIPSNIGDFPSLSQLDLSFNNLTGPIPDSLFNSSSLLYLFLGNNRLNGTPPELKRPLLQIDVSYNQLSPALPSWANNSLLATGLDCIQKNFPCLGGFPNYSNFAINCGGPEMTSSSQIVYERDNDPLGPATYYEASTKRWAVSNVGQFNDINNAKYMSVSSSQFNTSDSELLQTARISPGSLRYFGLRLENGNYMVTLQFAETTFLNPPTWKSLGRRVFDIYIQGNLVQKDFDIKKEAGGVSFQAVQMVFPAQVSKNYVEIHLFWAGKGTCCIPSFGTYGPSISAISAVRVTSDKKSMTGFIVKIVVPVGVVSFLSVLALYCFVHRRKRPGWDDDEELLGMDVRPYTISYAELKAATEDFNPANKLGEGGFGPVFKGTLNDGRVIAVKQLSVASRQGKDQFVAEIATTSAVQHRNLVKLYGCCIEGNKRLIVYEYLENRSLDQTLFGKTSLFLNWPIRFDICLGVARGLAYLHVESRLRIVHRDVKASNILLDSDLNPKVSDFGLAKLFDDKKTHMSTRVAGTFGYLAPEYAMLGQLTEKADVFGFGVVALEIVSGRPNTDSSLEEEKIYLLKWAWHVHENNHEVELVDARLLEFDEEEVKRVIRVALLCTQTSPQQRPSMPRVVAMLSGDIEVSVVTSRPGYFTDWNFDTTSLMTTDTPTA
ncbi:probable LRR receptor-like serine/threonine-protein kinase At1g56140 isoform X3 [Rhododendron vialii]|uniref:probable LRR receptor-like serine/threonine-protein kinase At1g56140 isoform X3 n=1 Tax=Rhododendron vialii TaxID=182163 RepID=UPI00265DA7A9|nr:probable LRR receptor-like serine/threonine-protein kinase At1g56140 isoform X3 [Rhododendron vialii]